MIMTPVLSCVGGSNIYTLTIHSFLHQIGFNLDSKSTSAIGPSKNSINRCIKKVGVETLAVLRRKLIGQKLFYYRDASNKGRCHHMVKRITWYDTLRNYLFIVALDSDVCDGTDSDAAHALDYSCRKIHSTDNDKVIFHGQSTGTGDGGTSNVLHSEMFKPC